MNESTKAKSPPAKPARWLFLLGLLGVVVAVFFGRPLFEWARPQPKSTAPLEIKLPPSPKEVALPHLTSAEQEAERVIEEHVKALDTFFADAKKGTPTFAAGALSWSSKWRLAADYVPFTEKNRHEKFIRSQFEDISLRPTIWRK